MRSLPLWIAVGAACACLKLKVNEGAVDSGVTGAVPVGGTGGEPATGGHPGPMRDSGGALDNPARPLPAMARLTLTVTGPGDILVDEKVFPCLGMCAIERPGGTPITLAARPTRVGTRPLASFLGWTGACVGKAGCVVTLDADKDVSAKFHRFLAWEELVYAGPSRNSSSPLNRRRALRVGRVLGRTDSRRPVVLQCGHAGRDRRALRG